MTLLIRPNFRPESWAQNAGNGISRVQISKKFQGGMPPDPPSYARPRNMIRSHFKLDPPLVLVDESGQTQTSQHLLKKFSLTNL
jgi:hypothetical protein